MKRPSTTVMARASLALLVLLLVLIWAASQSHPSPVASNPPVLVVTTHVTARDLPRYQTGVGTVVPNATVTVKVMVDGQLEKVAFKEGQDVKAGQLLARIDPRPLRAQLEQDQALLAKDQAQLTNAQLDLQRYTTLGQLNSISQQTLATQRALVAQNAATVKNDQALIDYAKVQLAYTTITAPLSGRTGQRLVDPGNIVHTTDTAGLVVINQVDPIAVTFKLPEQAFGAINQAQRASHAPLNVEAYDHNTGAILAHGQLSLVNNQIDTASGTVLLKAQFANATHALWPGQYVDIRLIQEISRQALTVPDAAIVRGPSGSYVYLVDAQQKAQMQTVTLDRTQDGIAVISAGLKLGARVVLDGQYKLKPGARVIEMTAAKTGAAQ